MRPDRMILSAYLDGEIPGRFVEAVEAAIRENAGVRADYEELVALRTRMTDAPIPDVAESAAGSSLERMTCWPQAPSARVTS